MSELILTPEQKEALTGMVKEAFASCVREDGEKQLRKDIADRCQEEIGIKKADFNKIVAEKFKGTASKAIETNQFAVDVLEQLGL